MDFWQKLKAVFDFGSRLITLTMPDGTREQIEFTIGDESAKEEVMQVYCVEDVVVPPRAAYLLKGSVGTAAQKVKLTLHDTWMVEARSKRDEEELESEAVAAVEAAQAARDAFSAKRRWAGGKSKRAAVEAGRDRRKRAATAPWEGGAAQGAECQLQEEYVEALLTQAGSGTNEADITHPKWCDEQRAAVLPVGGINTTTEPMVFRAGQRIGVATRLHKDTVNQIATPHMDTSSCDEGTTTKGMLDTLEHEEGDWRKGLSRKQVLEATREPQRDTAYKEWHIEWEQNIKIGEDKGQEGAVTEAIKD